MTTSLSGRTLIETFEGLRLTAYTDICGVWTIGYGHTGPEVTSGLTWTQAQADLVLEADLAHVESVLNNPDVVYVQLGQNKFDALVDFGFNLGTGALRNSTLLRLVNKHDFDGAAAQFARWSHARGVEVPALLRRRLAERDLFLTPDVVKF